MCKLHDIKSTSKAWFDKNGSVKSWFDKNGLKACATVSGISGSIMAMTTQVGAEGYTYSMDTVATNIFSLGTKALDFCLANEALATIFTLGVVSGVFLVVKKAKRAVK